MSGQSAFTRHLESEDERGPDSVECSSANGVTTEPPYFRHSDCFMDYSDLLGFLGFVCGCSCHDEEPEE